MQCKVGYLHSCFIADWGLLSQFVVVVVDDVDVVF